MILGIYGAGGLGREILILARQISDSDHRWSEIVFIDDSHSAGTEERVKGARVLSFSEAGEIDDDLEVVIAIGEPSGRAMLAERVESASGHLATLVHPGVCIPDCTSLGDGTIVCYGSFVSCDVRIGRNVLLQPLSSIGHDCSVGSSSVISSYVAIAGACIIGERTYIGMNSAIREKVRIGDDTIIGMSSAVFRDIPSEVIVLGNPARAARENKEHRVFK